MNVAERFTENLMHHRKRAGLSQEALALVSDLNRTEIGQLERGNRLPRIDTLVKLAGGLGIDPCDLLDGMVWTPGSASEGRFIETAVPGLGLVTRRFEVERHGDGSG